MPLDDASAASVKDCRICGERAEVIDSRDASPNWRKRRHRCPNGHAFNTMEILVDGESCAELFAKLGEPVAAPRIVIPPEQHIYVLPVQTTEQPKPRVVHVPAPLEQPTNKLEMGKMLKGCVSELRETLSKLSLLSELQELPRRRNDASNERISGDLQ